MTRTDILEAIQRAESAGFHVLARALVELLGNLTTSEPAPVRVG
jgi:hypothetical protein